MKKYLNKLLIAVATCATTFSCFGGLLDKVGDQANKVEEAYSAIWNGFYGTGQMKKLLEAELDLRPDGTPNIVLDRDKGNATFTIRLFVNDKEYNAWKENAHKRIESIGMSYSFSDFEDPEAHIIAGKAYRFGDNEESAIKRWEKSGKGVKASLYVGIAAISADGKTLRSWYIPLEKFERIGYAAYPIPLHNLNRLKDLPPSVFKWIKEAIDIESGVEDAFTKISATGMSAQEMAAIEDIRCVVFDKQDIVEELERQKVELERQKKLQTLESLLGSENMSADGVQLWENGPYWAPYNVGAKMPDECGYYFWWGDTVGYKREDDSWNAVDGLKKRFLFTEENCPTYGKSISKLRKLGYIDNTGNLVPAHDVATAHLGAPWRMPTDAEFGALVDNCDTIWTEQNGVCGMLVKGRGKYASKRIFLPAAGIGYDTYLRSLGSYGGYWSSTPNSDYSDLAWYLNFDSGNFDSGNFDSGNFDRDYNDRDYGQSVRPVRGFAK